MNENLLYVSLVLSIISILLAAMAFMRRSISESEVIGLIEKKMRYLKNEKVNQSPVPPKNEKVFQAPVSTKNEKVSPNNNRSNKPLEIKREVTKTVIPVKEETPKIQPPKEEGNIFDDFLNTVESSPMPEEEKPKLPPLSDKTNVADLKLPENSGSVVIDPSQNLILIEFEFDAVYQDIAPVFVLSEGAKLEPELINFGDFKPNSTKSFIVTAEDGTTAQKWDISITIKPEPIRKLLFYAQPPSDGYFRFIKDEFRYGSTFYVIETYSNTDLGVFYLYEENPKNLELALRNKDYLLGACADVHLIDGSKSYIRIPEDKRGQVIKDGDRWRITKLAGWEIF